MSNLSHEDLTCLNYWPEGTVGHQEEERALRILNDLCVHLGYGRVHQMMAAIKEIWDDPTQLDGYRKMQAALLRQLEESRQFLEKHKKESS
jgi:hypothetical protein